MVKSNNGELRKLEQLMVNNQSGRRIQVIPATRNAGSENALRRSDGILRAAAYCRVSTNTEEQLNSYEAQKAYYTQKIAENPNWELAGIFADRSEERRVGKECL